MNKYHLCVTGMRVGPYADRGISVASSSRRSSKRSRTSSSLSGEKSRQPVMDNPGAMEVHGLFTFNLNNWEVCVCFEEGWG